MKSKWIWKPVFIMFVVLLALSVLLSYNDDRDADGPLTIGFPLQFYYGTPGLGEVAPGQSDFNSVNFIGDLAIFFVVSMLITLLYQKFK